MLANIEVAIKTILRNVLVLTLMCAGSARAATILDISSDELLHQAEVLRTQLNLAATQSVPWLQAEAKSREILREQKARRERFQIETKEQIAGGRFSVKSALEGVGAEEAATQDDRRRLAELWTGVLSKLNDAQVRQVGAFLVTLMTTPAPLAPEENPKGPKTDEQPRQRGGRGGRSGSGTGGLGLSRGRRAAMGTETTVTSSDSSPESSL